MLSFSHFLAESPDNTASLPNLFLSDKHYQQLYADWLSSSDTMLDLGAFHGMKLFKLTTGRIEKYYGFVGERIVFYAVLRIDSTEYLHFFELTGTEMIHISKDPSVAPGVASAFFWQYHHRDSITSISDSLLTADGEAVWYKIIAEALQRQMFSGAINKTQRKLVKFDSVAEAHTFSGRGKSDWQFFVSSADTLRENYHLFALLTLPL